MSSSAPHPGAYLEARFLKPLRLTPAELARRCGMPRSRVSELVAGKRALTADTARRLAALFRMEPEFWMSLQSAWELAQGALEEEIAPLDLPDVLIGPQGVTALPCERRPEGLFAAGGDSFSRAPEGPNKRAQACLSALVGRHTRTRQRVRGLVATCRKQALRATLTGWRVGRG